MTELRRWLAPPVLPAGLLVLVGIVRWQIPMVPPAAAGIGRMPTRGIARIMLATLTTIFATEPGLAVHAQLVRASRSDRAVLVEA